MGCGRNRLPFRSSTSSGPRRSVFARSRPTARSRSTSAPSCPLPTSTRCCSSGPSRTCSRTRCGTHRPISGIDVTAACSGSTVELRVADHGPGVAPDDRERVFDEFVQLEGRASSAGVGLGLAITKAFVTANGGSVRCEETPGGGATFVLAMPTAQEDLS